MLTRYVTLGFESIRSASEWMPTPTIFNTFVGLSRFTCRMCIRFCQTCSKLFIIRHGMHRFTSHSRTFSIDWLRYCFCTSMQLHFDWSIEFATNACEMRSRSNWNLLRQLLHFVSNTVKMRCILRVRNRWKCITRLYNFGISLIEKKRVEREEMNKNRFVKQLSCVQWITAWQTNASNAENITTFVTQ